MRKAAPDEDLAGLAREIEQAQPEKADGEKQQPERAPLPTPAAPRSSPRTGQHDVQVRLAIKRIGEDVSEKRDYAPGVFTASHPRQVGVLGVPAAGDRRWAMTGRNKVRQPRAGARGQRVLIAAGPRARLA